MNGSSTSSASSAVDVVIPVFGGHPLVKRCLESVLAFRTQALGDVVVVDDASPDPETRELLAGLRAEGAIVLIRHANNRGFVASANAGIRASTRDVVLLNSDTEVHGDWLERLVRCAQSAPDVGTVTPFSNNATICSYPLPARRRRLPGGLSLAELDGLFARVNRHETAELPTGVGFCLLLRRTCLEAVGLFDEERFGRGYGEENDFCQRASRAGWRNVLCADTFVYHELGGTFGAERMARARAAEETLRSLHPEYGRRVRDFIAADRLGEFRRRVDAARASRSITQAVAVAAERAVERAWRIAVRVQARRW